MAGRETRRGGWRLAGALSGLLYVAFVFLGGAVIARTAGPGRHSLGATADEIAAYLADADPGRVWVGEYLGLLGFVLFLPFAAYAWSALAGARDRGPLRGVAFAAAAIYVALTAAGIAALAPALNRSADPASAAPFLDLRTTLLGLGFVFLAVWLVAAGAHALRTGGLPGWLAWSAVAIGALQIAATPLAAYDPGFTGVPTFASFLWIAVVSVILARRERGAAATA